MVNAIESRSLEAMATNHLNARGRPPGQSSNLRISPSNSPVLWPPSRYPHKPSLHQSTLSLQTVIGTTTSSATGFSSHDQSKSFAFCAGSAAVLAELDQENNVAQRFFRARPYAVSINPVPSYYSQSAVPTTPDSRPRSLSNLKTGSYVNGSPSNDFPESNSPRAWSSKERVRAVTSVSISPNGRFLALGETGYNPRVLIFSTARDSPPDIPLTILNEHTVGVRSLAFSSNAQYLATLGNVNDGFLFVWAIGLKNGSARLHSTNKCTAFVRDMHWMGRTLVTVGIRHVKVWRLPETRPASPTKSRSTADSTPTGAKAPKALSGRNCLLGPLGENTFTCVTSISDTEAVVGTETGALCYLDDSDGTQKLSLIKYAGYAITSMATDIDQAALWVGGHGRRIQKFSFDSLRSSVATAPSSPKSLDKSPPGQARTGPAVNCIGSLSSHLVTIDATRGINVYLMAALNDDGELGHSQVSMPAHRDPVLGIASLEVPNDLSAEFFTWSSKGNVHFWDTQGTCRDSRRIDLEQLPGNEDGLANELKILRATPRMDLFVSGDRFGVLRIMSGWPWKCANEVRAHGGEVTDIAIKPGPESCLIASAARDRMVQLFQRSDDDFQLVQTMDDHVGAVVQLLFVNDGEKLLSSSADRTILVRERITGELDGSAAVAYMISKVIILKASPMSMILSPADTLVVSSMDRCIQKFDLTSGKQVHSFRASDPDSCESVVMTSLNEAAEVQGQSPKLLIGVSSTDKSIRVYDCERNLLLAGEFGHTEGVSDVLLLEGTSEDSDKTPKRTLISAGMDGVVMIWNLSVQQQQLQELVQSNARDDEESPTKGSTASKPPLRRILSKNELAGFQRQDGSLPATPTPMHEPSPSLRKRMSRYGLAPPSENVETPTSPTPSTRRPPTSCASAERSRRSPSPVSPKSTKPGASNDSMRRPSMNFRSQARSSRKSEFGSLNMSTEQLCRTLKTYRRKLNFSSEHLTAQADLEHELTDTLRTLNARSQCRDHPDAEANNNGKENVKLPSKPRSPHMSRMVSTPNLGQKANRKVRRSHSFNNGEVDG